MSNKDQFRKDITASITLAVSSQLRRRSNDSSLAWPLKTRDVFSVLRQVGYAATQKALDYCVARYGLAGPKKIGGRLAWTAEDVAEFALYLERLRRWLPGFHAKKKTWHELDAEVGNESDAND